MQIERRGKYPGVKVHLDEDECKQLAALATSEPLTGNKTSKVVMKLAGKIAAQLKEDKTTLQARTEEEIITELQTERDKAIEKLSKLAAGKAWNSK